MSKRLLSLALVLLTVFSFAAPAVAAMNPSGEVPQMSRGGLVSDESITSAELGITDAPTPTEEPDASEEPPAAIEPFPAESPAVPVTPCPTTESKQTVAPMSTDEADSTEEQSEASDVPAVAGVVNEGGKLYYRSPSNGQILKGGWVRVNGVRKYYADKDGVLKTGLCTIGKLSYYFNLDDGHVMKGGFVTIGGLKYYLNAKDGHVMKNGFITVKGQKYFLNQKDGHVMKGGIVTVKGNKYYCDAKDGHILRNGWIKVKGVNKYYADENGVLTEKPAAFSLKSIPKYSGSPYVIVNKNVPDFVGVDHSAKSFESYSSLDALSRCGVAFSCIGRDLMPTGDRGDIGQIKPTGWHTVKYDIVDGKYLYNRCHLIGYQLTAENANTRNLITGTRYLNVEGMLPFENMVADYIKETGNHVFYRVTPIFAGNNLLASGVHMEAESVEDDGEGILFNVYCYNVQPGIVIDYATGDSWLEGGAPSATTTPAPTPKPTPKPPVSTSSYVLNTNSHVFHYPSCSSVSRMSAKNRWDYTGTRDEIIAMGYTPCGRCHP